MRELLLLSLCSLALAKTARAEVRTATSASASAGTASAADGRSDEKPLGPFSLSFSADAAVGIGTFVSDQNADSPWYGSSLSLTGAYELAESLSISAGLSGAVEWTYLVTPCHPAEGPRAPGAKAEDCSDTEGSSRAGTADQPRATFDDVELSLDHEKLLELAGFTLSGAARLALPTSRDSRAVGNLFTLGAGLSVSRPLGPMTPSLSTSVSKFFPTATAAVLERAEAERGDLPIGHCSNLRESSCLLLTGFVPTYRVSLGADVRFEIPPVEGLSATISVGYAYSRAFGTGGDSLSSTKTDGSGRPVVDGVNASDTTSGSIEIGYAVDDRLSLALGVSSGQPAKTDDGKALRFPFFDFVSPSNNYSSWYLSAAYGL
ncbi:MAG: hypothetical protein HYV07_06745 [Deltaproteobacteria bacterium]|nr:hypothetical protein [Deltaproteobacteria bacterium]